MKFVHISVQNYYMLNKILNVFFYKNVEKVIKIKWKKERRNHNLFTYILIFFSQNRRKCHIVPFVVTHMNIMFLPFYPKNPINMWQLACKTHYYRNAITSPCGSISESCLWPAIPDFRFAVHTRSHIPIVVPWIFLIFQGSAE